MRTSALQEFLRSLGGPLAAVGVAPRSVTDLHAAADALEPFRELDLDQLADFLRRADEFRRSGAVPVADAAGVDGIRTAARRVAEGLLALPAAEPAAARDLDGQITRAKAEFQEAVATLAGSFGSNVKFTDDKKWLPALREQAAARQAADAFRRLLPRITSAEVYRDPAIHAEIEQLAAAGDPALKAAAQELGAAAGGKGRKLVELILVKLTGFKDAPAKAARTRKQAADPARLAEVTRTLTDMAERAKDPAAVPDAEVDATIDRLKAEFSAAELKVIAKDVTGVNVRGGADALLEIRAKLTETKRILESQKV
jgi:hypothetical protein